MNGVIELARIPRQPPRVDLAIAGACLAWALLEVLLITSDGPLGARLATAAGYALPLVWRRRAPLLGLLLVVAAFTARLLVVDGAEDGSMPFPSLLILVFSAGLYGRPFQLTPLTIAIPPVIVEIAYRDGYFVDPRGAVDYAIFTFLTAGAWTAGYLVRRRAQQLAEAQAAAPEMARAAVLEERARVARELHDIVAHSVSIIAVQAGALEAQVRKNPDAAAGHARAVRRTAHEVLVELRHLLGALRDDDAPYAPQPGLERLGDLIEESRATGLRVDLVEAGQRTRLPPGVDLACYRIIQEGLTNVRKHAGAVDTRVRVERRADAVEIEIVNAAGTRRNRAGGAGHGLIGMQERARLYGGSFEAAPLDDGGFRVHARLPVEGEQP